jgi:hypothetical protein
MQQKEDNKLVHFFSKTNGNKSSFVSKRKKFAKRTSLPVIIYSSFRWFIFKSFMEIFSGSAYKNLQKLGEAFCAC